jgi:hypothetical protein
LTAEANTITTPDNFPFGGTDKSFSSSSYKGARGRGQTKGK